MLFIIIETEICFIFFFSLFAVKGAKPTSKWNQ